MIEAPIGWGGALKELGRHGPDALLAFLLFLAFLWALKVGINPIWAIIGLVVVWSCYHIRRVASERHTERQARIDVDNLENTRGADVKRHYRNLGDEASSERDLPPVPAPARRTGEE